MCTGIYGKRFRSISRSLYTIFTEQKKVLAGVKSGWLFMDIYLFVHIPLDHITYYMLFYEGKKTKTDVTKTGFNVLRLLAS